MRIAKLENGERISIAIHTTEKVFCPSCGGVLIAKSYKDRANHFAHKAVGDCGHDQDVKSRGKSNGTSDWHIDWQDKFPVEMREVRTEHDDKLHIADIRKDKWVIEFQHSPMTSDAIMERTEFYKNNGYRIIWVFDKTGETNIQDYTTGNMQNVLNYYDHRNIILFDDGKKLYQVMAQEDDLYEFQNFEYEYLVDDYKKLQAPPTPPQLVRLMSENLDLNKNLINRREEIKLIEDKCSDLLRKETIINTGFKNRDKSIEIEQDNILKDYIEKIDKAEEKLIKTTAEVNSLSDKKLEFDNTMFNLNKIIDELSLTKKYKTNLSIFKNLEEKIDSNKEAIRLSSVEKNKLVGELYSYLNEVPKETKLMIKYLIKLYQGHVDPKLIGSNLVYNEDAMRAVVKGEDNLIGKLIELSRLDR